MASPGQQNAKPDRRLARGGGVPGHCTWERGPGPRPCTGTPAHPPPAVNRMTDRHGWKQITFPVADPAAGGGTRNTKSMWPPLAAIFLLPQTKLRKGNVFTSVSQEFCPHGGRCTPPGADRQTPSPWADTSLGRHPNPRQTIPPPPKSDGHCSRRYTSYWNAFLFMTYFYRAGGGGGGGKAWPDPLLPPTTS